MTSVPTNLGMSGKAPLALVETPEQMKYRKMWEKPEYRITAPGEQYSMDFIRQANIVPGSEVIDFGAGTGRGAMLIAFMRSVHVHMLDFVDNSLDQEVRDAVTNQKLLSFTKHDLTEPIALRAKYGYCTDVMEHIPEEDVDVVLDNILHAAQRVYFSVCTVKDGCGKLIGEELHNTVKPFTWWLEKFREHEVNMYYAQEFADRCVFYCTSWTDVKDLYKKGQPNTGIDEILDNIRSNVARGLEQARPHERTNQEAMILGGGPSLNDFADEIIERRATGTPLICLNGTYNWAIEHGMEPSAAIMVDAREFNSRFVNPVVPACKYLLASQCNPKAFDAVPADQTYIWHSVCLDSPNTRLLDELYVDEPWFIVPGGSTVMTRAFLLMRMLGWWRFRVFGFDSCLMGEDHHAYEQKENDGQRLISIEAGGKIFKCHPWMAGQAQEFMDITKYMGDEVDMIVYGEGLIAHIIKEAAEAA